MNSSGIKRQLLTAAGILFVFLGAVGIFVPLLPTTPFLLLAAGCFIRSSPRLYDWMMNHRVFGSYIKNYREQRAVAAKVKAVTLLLLWAAIGYSVFTAAQQLWLQISLILIAAGVSWHVLSLKTLPSGKRRRKKRKSD